MIPLASRILGYLASVAPRGPSDPLRMRIDITAFELVEPHLLEVVASDDGLPEAVVASDRNLAQLAAADRLHRFERLLRIGWLTLAGPVGDDRALLNLVEVPVALSQAGRHRWEARIAGDPRFPPAVAESPAADALEGLVGRWSEPGFLAGAHADPEVAAAVAAASEVLGFGGRALLPADVHPVVPWNRDEAAVCTGVVFYLSRNPMAIDTASTLRRWANEDPTGTALERLYAAGDRPDPDDGPIASPLPLNDKQRLAVATARTAPVTVVSGPPGTGKSHVVAAMALDAVDRGKSVLVATQSEHAADVIGGLLERVEGAGALRFGNPAFRRRAADVLSQGAPPISERLEDVERALLEARAGLDDKHRRIVGALAREEAFERAIDGRDRLQAATSAAPGVRGAAFDLARAERALTVARSAGGPFAGWRRRRAERRLRGHVEADPTASLDEIGDAVAAARSEAVVRRVLREGGLRLEGEWPGLEAAEQAWRRAAGAALAARRLEGRRRASRAVAGLATALRSGRTLRRRALERIDARDLVGALPLWLGTLSDIDDDLPIRPGLFDLVILDEASQIDQGRASSALARATQAVVVGDPRQLRHVSFVADDAMAEAASGASLSPALAAVLDVRRNSLFDAAAAGADVIRLDEHFRSVPHLIGFSDRRFYDGSLRLMTQHPRTESADAISVVDVGGDRGEDRVNRDQVAAAVERVAALIDDPGVATIGVVTPFRAQADAIEREILDTLPPDLIDEAGLLVGTVHAFQGAERDAVVVATAIGPDDPAGLRFLEDPNLFNVMVTRARLRVDVLLSVPPDSMPDGLLRDYLRHAAHPPAAPSLAEAPAGWVGDVARALAPFGQRVAPGYRVAGWNVDIALGAGADALAVEASVHPDGPEMHVERHLALRRAGWSIVDAYRSAHLADPDGAAGSVVERLLERQRTNEGGSGR